MIEAPFGSTSAIWATAPTPGFALQTPMQPPVGLGNSAIGAPAFGTSALMGSPSNLPAFPFAAAPPPVLMNPEPIAGVTAPVLLGAVALRRGQPQGPTNDQEVEDFIYDALEFLSGTTDVDIRCENGRATLTGNVHHKRIKRDVGEIAWAIPGVNDVQNNVTIASRRRARAGREPEVPNPQTRK